MSGERESGVTKANRARDVMGGGAYLGPTRDPTNVVVCVTTRGPPFEVFSDRRRGSSPLQ